MSRQPEGTEHLELHDEFGQGGSKEMNAMRTIIAGGSGLIGRALTEDLTTDGHEVIILSRSPERVRGLPAGAQAVGWDGLTAEGWQEHVDGADAIVNLAGTRIAPWPWTADRKRQILESRVHAGEAVTQAIEAASKKPQVVVQASGVGFYGPRGDEAIDEDTEAGDDFLAQVCIAWEAATEPVEALGVRRVRARTGLVFSRAGGLLPLVSLPYRLLLGGPMGSGRQGYPWIHIADHVAAVRWLIDDESATGAFNLVAPQRTTNASMSRAMGQALGRPAFMTVPAFVLRLILGEEATILLDGQHAVPARLQEQGYSFRFPTAEAALSDLFG